MSFHSWALFAGSFVPNVDENRATLVLYKTEKILLKIPWQSQDDEVPKSQKMGLAKGSWNKIKSFVPIGLMSIIWVNGESEGLVG